MSNGHIDEILSMTRDMEVIESVVKNTGRFVGNMVHISIADLATALRQHQQDVKAVYYCERGQSLDGLEKGAMAVLANLMIKTNADTADFMIGNENDGEFHFSCKRIPPAPKKENDDDAA